MTCEQSFDDADDVDALALDALPAVEATRVQAHLASCVACAARYRTARAVVDCLPNGVPLVRAPASMRAAVLAAAAATSGTVMPLSVPESPVRAQLRTLDTSFSGAKATAPGMPAAQQEGRVLSFLRRGGIPVMIAAAFAGLVVLGLSAWTADLQRQIHDLKRQQVAAVAPTAPVLPLIASSATDAETAALVLLSSPTTVRAPLGNPAASGPSGAVFWNPEQKRCVILARQLVAPDPGHEYHIWFRTQERGWDGGALARDPNGNAEIVVPTDRWQIDQGYTITIGLQPVVDDGSRQPVLSGEIRSLTQ